MKGTTNAVVSAGVSHNRSSWKLGLQGSSCCGAVSMAVVTRHQKSRSLRKCTTSRNQCDRHQFTEGPKTNVLSTVHAMCAECHGITEWLRTEGTAGGHLV